MLVRSFFCATLVSLALIFAPTARAAEKALANVAHIKLTGDLSETPVNNELPIGPPKENFKSKLDRIRKAKDDSSIDGLFLQIEGLAVGQGKVDELRHAIADFRSGGKKAFAYLEAGSAVDYLVATACDSIVVPESGWLMLIGMRMELEFYKNLFEKVGVKADMLQMGDFKGAAEPYTRANMSPQLRKQMESLLDDQFEKGMVEVIASARKGLTPEQVKQLIDNGPYTARAAKEAKLVDEIAYDEGFEQFVASALESKKIKVTKDYGKGKMEELDLSNPFALLKLLAPPKAFDSGKPKVAVVYVTGVISTGKSMDSPFGGETAGSTTLVEAIRKAENDRSVKAIVLRVDSPGGSALASDLIWNELRNCKKPVIASMGDVAASGGYYVSMAAKKIYAEPGTITGSIGVVGGKIALGGLFNKVGLTTDVIARGKHSGILSATEPFSDSEREAMRALMKDVYDQFLNKAVQGRQKAGKQLDRAGLEPLAGGRVWTGRQAVKNGLVDQLGTLDDAVADAWEMAGMPKTTKPEWMILPKPRSFLDALFDSDSGSGLPFGRMPGLAQVPELQGQLQSLEALLRLRGEPIWAITPYRVRIR